MNRITTLLLLGCLCGLLSSCLEDINLDTGERILNVYCILKQGSEQELELTYLKPIGGESQPVVEDATITLYDGDTSVGQFTRTSETKWNLDYTPQGGHSYRLEVNVPGEETVTAETRYPTPGSIQGVQGVDVEESARHTDPYFPYTGFLGFELDTSEDQILWCYVENRREGPVITGYIASDHPGVDGRGETIYPYDWDSPVFKKKFDNGTSMHYLNSGGGWLSSYCGEEIPFLHEKVLRIQHPAGFSRKIDNEKLRIYHFGSNGNPVEDKTCYTGMFCFGTIDASGSFVINSVSAEYDKYMADYYYVKHRSYDFTDLVYRKNHYSNIVNGAGIFGASYEYQRVYLWF